MVVKNFIFSQDWVGINVADITVRENPHLGYIYLNKDIIA